MQSRARRIRRSLIGVAVCAPLAFFAPAHPAQAATCGNVSAYISLGSVYSYTWRGSAVGMCTTWTYSWVVQLRKYNQSVIDQHTKTNFSGTTSTSTPSYTTYLDPRVYGTGPFCTYFALHHGTTNASPLVDSFTFCNDGLG
jgi:hypothetical protein